MILCGLRKPRIFCIAGLISGKGQSCLRRKLRIQLIGKQHDGAPLHRQLVEKFPVDDVVGIDNYISTYKVHDYL